MSAVEVLAENDPTVFDFERYAFEQRRDWAYVFGETELHAGKNLPQQEEQVAHLVSSIEKLATGPGSGYDLWLHDQFVIGNGVDTPRVIWNDAQIAGGLAPSLNEYAVARIESFSYAEVFNPLPRHATPLGRYSVRQSFYINPMTEKAMIWRAREPYHGGRGYSGEKQADALDIAYAQLLVDRAIAKSSKRPLPTYLEIGHGLDPAVFQGGRDFSCRRYVGLDPAVGNYETDEEVSYAQAVTDAIPAFRRRAEAERPGQHIEFIAGDGHTIPLPTGSVREVFASNVFNAPGDQLPYKECILREADRVIWKGGRLVLRVDWHTDVWTPEKMTNWLRTAGELSVKATISSTDTRYERFKAQYGTQSAVPAPDEGYFIVAEPQIRW